jgi:hypothetical protein
VQGLLASIDFTSHDDRVPNSINFCKLHGFECSENDGEWSLKVNEPNGMDFLSANIVLETAFRASVPDENDEPTDI